jgi:hypothetical protein
MQGRLSTLTDVTNRALGLLGEDPITDYAAPDTDAGVKVKPWVLETIDEVQSSFLWQEIFTSTSISKDATDAHDGRQRYALPANCLRPLGFRNSLTGLAETVLTHSLRAAGNAYDVEGNYLLTSGGDTIDLVYNKREDDPTKWTAELGRCIYHAIAVNAGQSVTSDSRIVMNILEKYEKLVRPRARLLQSRYKSNPDFLPRGFTYINSYRAR